MNTYLLGDLSARSLGLPMADHVLIQQQARRRYLRRRTRRRGEAGRRPRHRA